MIVGECVLCGWCCSNIFSIKIKATGKVLKGFDALSVTECAKCGIDERFETLPEITKCVYLGEDNKCKNYSNRPECCRNYPIERDLKFDNTPSCGYRLEEGNES